MHLTAHGRCRYTDNWAVTVNLHDAATHTSVPGTSRHFQGCTAAFYDENTRRCTLMDDESISYPLMLRRTLTVTTPGDYVTHYRDGVAENYYQDYLADSLWQNTFTAKFSTRTELGVTRSGRYVTFHALATHYSTVTHTFRPSTSASLKLQRFIDGQWVMWRTMTTNSDAPRRCARSSRRCSTTGPCSHRPRPDGVAAKPASPRRDGPSRRAPRATRITP